jgi:UDP-N-acetylglucosamine 2-epimerase
MLLDTNEIYQKMAKAVSPYEDSRACVRIVDIIKKKFIPQESCNKE